MTLSQRMMADLKEAMKNKDVLKKGVLTLMRSGLATAEKEKKEPLSEAEETAIVQRELKQARQTLTEAENAGREDIVKTTRKKIVIIETYLPQMMTAEEIVSFLESKGVKKGDHIGKIMGLLMQEHKGKVDGTLAKEVINTHFA